MTIEEYNRCTPKEQGFISYMRSNWDDWDIPQINPYPDGSKEFSEWASGEQAAIIDVMDSEG